MILEFIFLLYIICTYQYINYEQQHLTLFNHIFFYIKVTFVNYMVLKTIIDKYYCLNEFLISHHSSFLYLILLLYYLFDYIFFYKIMTTSINIHHIIVIVWIMYGYLYNNMLGYNVLIGLIDISSLFLSVIELYKPKNSNFINILFVISYFIFRICYPIFLLYYTITHDEFINNSSIMQTNIFLCLIFLLNLCWFYEICKILYLQIKIFIKKNNKKSIQVH